MQLDYYKILHLARDATAIQILDAYKQQSVEWHPAQNAGQEVRAEKRFRRISEAYQILNDADLRRAYDNALKMADKKAKRRKKRFGGGKVVFLEDEVVDSATSTDRAGADKAVQGGMVQQFVHAHKCLYAQPKETADETPLGKNLMIQRINGNSVTCFPETLLALRNPYRVYNEVIHGKTRDTSQWAYCEQIFEWHIASTARMTDFLDVFGNKVIVTTQGYSDGNKTINVTRNGKMVQSLCVKCEEEDWLAKERAMNEGNGHIIVIEEAPDPPPGMRRLPRPM